MKTKKSPEEQLFEKEGRGRFNLKNAMTFYELPLKRPRAVGINLPVVGRDTSPVLPRVKLVPRLQKDAMGNDVRVFVPAKKKRRNK
jgi:hypothetical protein